ncbi:hypothetical protein F5Y17DRAFT_463809 [Xylariaceae sp. FL0594]|nr:hypothetical protein F5Y17DRAFT_463809 [Xylariaceae sp. FL0594]
MGIGVHATTSQPATCHLHHSRCPDQVRFIYESRPEQIYDADAPPRGRCDLRSDLSPEEARRANDVLARFGADTNQLPFYGEGNCHNWAAGAVGALEEAGLALPGDGERWMAVIGKGPVAMEAKWKEAGRVFVPCERFSRPPPEVVDAKWGQERKEEREQGDSSLESSAQLTPRFKEKLVDLLVSRKNEAGSS